MLCRIATLTAAAVLVATTVRAQTPVPAPTGSAPPAADRAWSIFASAYTYIVPNGDSYVQPTVTADRGRLHLEGRYNYESQHTGSAWVGVNFAGGDRVEWELTPIFGAVFGEIDGVAPGYKGSVSWRKLSLYSESEYVIDAANTSDSFLYNWSELTYEATEAWRFGLVVQRTRAYQTDRDVQRGLIAGYIYKQAEFTLCVFNPDEDKPTVAFSVGWRW